jgi:hypothetical protein
VRLERFTEVDTPAAGALRMAGAQFALALLFVALTLAGGLVSARADAPERVREGVRVGVRGVLVLALGPPRVGVQIGHDGVETHPNELAHLRGNTGGQAGDLSELAVNRAVAAALAARLETQGVAVDLLGATPPAGYHADLLLSLHADSVLDPSRQGYKSAHFSPPRSPLEPTLKGVVDAAYLARTGLPDDSLNTTGNMRRYYAFNFRRYAHSVHPSTPALLVELGYLSSPSDAQLLRRPEDLADALTAGVVTFLRARHRLP